MARQRTKYKLVGRYMRGNDTVYYGLISEDGREIKYTEEQMTFIVGREQVINVSGQLYNTKVLFRGVNCDIKSLPVIQINEGNKPVIKYKETVKELSTADINKRELERKSKGKLENVVRMVITKLAKKQLSKKEKR